VLEEGEKVSTLFEDGEQVMALAGEAYMNEIDMEKVKEIEKELSKLAKTISDEWKLRHFQSPLEKAASIVLGKEAFEDSLEEDTTGDDTVTRAHRQMLRKIEGLIKLLPQYQQDKFDAVEILPGYLCWFEFNWVQVPESVPLNEVYSVWYKKQVKKENSPECNGKFAALFQNIQIRSSSEAIAETVGSIMANHIGKGRYLNPHNFSKEICLEYNLGPQVSLLLKGTYGISF
jgi:hypothetical protein